jgi:hypothetical protein
MPIASYPRITLNTTGQTNNPRSGSGLAIYNQSTGQYVIADSSFFPINNGGLASETTLLTRASEATLLTRASEATLLTRASEATLLTIGTKIDSANTYNQNVDISVKFTLTDTLSAIGSGECKQVVLIAPVNGVYVTVRGGGEMFIPPYSTIPVNASNLNQISARYATAGDFLSYYYH